MINYFSSLNLVLWRLPLPHVAEQSENSPKGPHSGHGSTLQGITCNTSPWQPTSPTLPCKHSRTITCEPFPQGAEQLLATVYALHRGQLSAQKTDAS